LKGIVYLIRALAFLHKDISSVRLEIAGSGPQRKALEQEVQLHCLGNHVRFLGWQADLMPLMEGWDVYVQPAVGEPFGITALEAMAAGLPVVATWAGGLPELVEDGRTGCLVPPRDPVALADRLRALLLNPEQRRRMGEAGRARATESFSVDRMIKSISSIYDEVLADRKRAVQ
jgi:colanic acid/amylovoran biosynthesis glycosyltransferase